MDRLFAWSPYYPGGGLNDLVFEGNSVDECWKYLAEENYDHYQIVDDKFVVLVEG